MAAMAVQAMNMRLAGSPLSAPRSLASTGCSCKRSPAARLPPVRCSANEDEASNRPVKLAVAAAFAALAVGNAQAASIADIAGLPEAIQQKKEEIKSNSSQYADVGKRFSDGIAAKVGYGESSKGERDDQVEALENAPEGAFNLGARPSQSNSTNFGQTGDVEGEFGTQNVGR